MRHRLCFPVIAAAAFLTLASPAFAEDEPADAAPSLSAGSPSVLTQAVLRAAEAPPPEEKRGLVAGGPLAMARTIDSLTARRDAPIAARDSEPEPPRSQAAVVPPKSEAPVSAGAVMAHLASYKDQATADAGWRMLQRKHAELGALTPRFVSAEVAGKGTYLRLYAVGERPAVQAACSALKAQSLYCQVAAAE